MEEFIKSWTEKAQEAFTKGGLPLDWEIPAEVTGRMLESGNLFMNLMNTVQQSLIAASQKETADNELNKLFEKISQGYLKFYQEQVGKYLTVPQLGLSREALHQLMTAVDSYHRLLEAIAEFGLKFSLPLTKSLEVLSQEIKDREKTTEDFKSAQEIINLAVTILEKNYDDFLKSAEGVKSVVQMVETYLEVKEKTDAVLSQIYKFLSLPTKREMEDVYKRIHELRKKTRQQDATILEQRDHLKRLNQKVLELEAALAALLPDQKASVSKPLRKKTKVPSSGTARKTKAL
ncbi:MAG: hypothetical protein C0407_03990 [Desulfobacca sp.]|nr:hypothetical protein [Desulfobacca sp.]